MNTLRIPVAFRLLWALTVCFMSGACGRSDEGVEIVRLDGSLPAGVMPAQGFERDAAGLLFRVSGYGELDERSVAEYAQRPSVALHVRAVDSVFTDLGVERAEFSKISRRFAAQLPEVSFPHLVSIISPFNQSVILADTVLYIGLNHYLGADYGPYAYFPDYQRVLKERVRIPIDVVEALVRSNFPFEAADDYPTALSRMLYEGAVVEAVHRIAECSYAEALGYTPDRFGWMHDNEAGMWNKIVRDGMLFSTDSSVARSLVDSAPYTLAVSSETPGRAGRFIGSEIVRSYVRNNQDTTLRQLLSPDFYNSYSALVDAGYKP